MGASVGVAQYGKDLIKLILSTLYESSKFKPSLVAPGGFYEKYWYDRLLQVSGLGIINVLTHHLYNLGPGSDEHLERKILDHERLSRVESIFGNLSEIIKIYGPWSSAWVGEAGGAYNSGVNHVSNRFLNSFWWKRKNIMVGCSERKRKHQESNSSPMTITNCQNQAIKKIRN
ncbi:hypothetical protein JHK82_028077 [Glycine max]|nr:hypothetical protein JHK86_028200 [Glycine max]KAG5127242.1 hypothetical protein JHK82_028077 [Glycine max]KAG5151855.1 hypothetical protein JHK84_028327 [Glycine max]